MGESFKLTPPASGDSNSNGSGGDQSLIPDKTTLRAAVVKIQTEDKPYEDKVTGEKVKKVVFRFRVTEDGEFTGRNLYGETSTAFVDHENCKLRSWIGEILSVEDLPSGFSFNTDDLIDLGCRIFVEQYSYKDRDGVTQYRNRVADVLRERAGVGV